MGNPRNDLTYLFTAATGLMGKLYFSPANGDTVEYAAEHYTNRVITELHPDFDTCGKYVIVKRGDEILDMGRIDWYGTHGAGIYFQDLRYLYNDQNRRAELQDYVGARSMDKGDSIEITPHEPFDYRKFTFAKFEMEQRDLPFPKAMVT